MRVPFKHTLKVISWPCFTSRLWFMLLCLPVPTVPQNSQKYVKLPVRQRHTCQHLGRCSVQGSSRPTKSNLSGAKESEDLQSRNSMEFPQRTYRYSVNQIITWPPGPLWTGGPGSIQRCNTDRWWFFTLGLRCLRHRWSWKCAATSPQPVWSQMSSDESDVHIFLNATNLMCQDRAGSWTAICFDFVLPSTCPNSVETNVESMAMHSNARSMKVHNTVYSKPYEIFY